MIYLPLAYVRRFNELTQLYCSKDKADCEPEILLEMIADTNWGTNKYSGINTEKYRSIYKQFNYNFFSMHQISACFAVAGFVGIWQKNKIVYEPDYDFSKILLETEHLKVYPDMLKHLPYNVFYLDFSKNSLFSYEGFFVQTKVFENGTIRITSLPTENNFSHIPVHSYEEEPTAYSDTFWILPELLKNENGKSFFDYDYAWDFMNTSDSYQTQWFIGGISNYRLFLLQFLMYLSSKEPDVMENHKTAITFRPSRVVKNKYSEIRKWDVGVHYGAKIRIFEQNKQKSCTNDLNDSVQSNSSSMKRPHIRKAHWESYHTGKGRLNIITKWKEPIFVNGNSDDIVPTIQMVTNKGAEGSTGEELIKQYLISKNIAYRWQHCVKEIGRKRFDFSIELNGNLVFIEFDGEQHFKAINCWKGKKGYQERRKADQIKNTYCLQNNIPLLRIRFDQRHLIPLMIEDLMQNADNYKTKCNTYLTNNEYYNICE